jgi:DNA-binding response OmpR family regulator
MKMTSLEKRPDNLFRNRARPVWRIYIAVTVWCHDERINACSMTVHVSAIRTKLELHAESDLQLRLSG